MTRLLHIAAVVAALALALAGCGATGGGGTTATAATTTVDTVSDDCAKAVGPFIDGLKGLNSRLGIGLTYAEYGTQLGSAKAAYDDVKWSDLESDCTKGVGVDAEAAMNHYITAYGTWRDCIESTSCDNASIKPKLQAEWAEASTLIDKIRARLP